MKTFKIAVFPLNNSILVDKVALPFHIFEERYKSMINKSQVENFMITVLPLENSNHYEDKYCYAGNPVIIKKFDNGEFDIILMGEGKFKLQNQVSQSPFLVYEAIEIKENNSLYNQDEEDLEILKNIFKIWLGENRMLKIQDELFESISKTPNLLVNYITLFLIKDLKVKQDLVELNDLAKKIQFLLNYFTPNKIDLGPFLSPIIKK